ncbi:MAG: hypothetical protein Q8O33_05365 [Pseudomonadota bacterium]|nr:hypothetical protein [Pseudomonadota bacterium]
MPPSLMRSPLSLALLSLGLGGLTMLPANAEELSVNTRSDVLFQSVTGAGKASSFYDTGTHLMHETDVRWGTQIMDGKWNSLLNTTLRATDSRQFDPENLSIQKLEWKLSDANTQINFGDYFANLSPYSMTKGIKGAAFQRNFENDQNYVRAAYGSFDGQWAYLLRSPAQEPMDRYGGGVRIQKAGEKARVGFNLAHVEDSEGDPRRTDPAFSQMLGAVDWEYRESALVVSGEHAFADTDEMRLGVATQSRNGNAHKISARAALKNLNLDGQAERVSSNFLTLGGGATPDRLRYYLKGDYKLTREWRLFATWDDYEDNVDNQLARTTETSSLELGVKKSRAFGRRHMNVSTSWRQKNTDASDGSRDDQSDRIKFKISDRVGENYDWRGEVERVLDENHTTPSNATSTLWDFGLGYRKRLESSWDIRANLDVGRQETGNLTTPGQDVSDRIRIGFTADRGNGTQVGASYDWSDANLVTALADNNHKRANVYWQTKPAWLKSGYLKFDYSDYLHNFEDSTKDYREQIGKISLVWNFQKEAKK